MKKVEREIYYLIDREYEVRTYAEGTSSYAFDTSGKGSGMHWLDVLADITARRDKISYEWTLLRDEIRKNKDNGFTEKEQKILELYYCKRMTLTAVAEKLEVTQKNLMAMHHELLHKLPDK